MNIIVIACFVTIIALQVLALRKGDKTVDEGRMKGKLFTGKRTFKVLSPLIRGKNETCYVVLEDITNPESPIAFVLNQERIHNTEQDGSSVGLSKLSQDGVYTISDKPFLKEHAYAKDGEYDYFASRIY